MLSVTIRPVSEILKSEFVEKVMLEDINDLRIDVFQSIHPKN